MNGDAERKDAPSRAWVGLLAIVLLVGAGLWWVSQLASTPAAPQRQVARIALLPDTPPPPPPPPKEEKQPEPKEQRPQNQPVPQPDPTPPQPQQVREEGPTGDAPSALAGGNVNTEGVPAAPVSGIGSGSPGGTGTASSRAEERFYAQAARQLLRDAIERHLKGDTTQATAEFQLWIEPSGAIRRFELNPSGNRQADDELRTALADATREVKLPPPPDIPQPMRFRVSLRPA
ncbi:TonB C-terminal domain-containing protein [Aquincola sp. J276]|uniref:TonB C-terminal domain-containing protein n=1 Tax=Aquincola sp. J276 TaxID=2898432 RepID=UPI002150F157|nr:TonB C-terminal domain-containing protein [Aquincola sp. J276]MCR5867678.1 TonB C-terminal domain-containing protein [Aquincola sp. J276]